MNEQWFKEYVLLAFRMDKAIRKFTESRFVDYYYGPPEWKAEAEAEKPADELVRDAMSLEDTLVEQGFEAHRAIYLEKQVEALETVCRKLNGETFSLEEEVQRCFDIHPERIPESQFEQGLALLDEALPGDGSLPDRLQGWRNRYQLVQEKSGLLLNFMQRAAAESLRRTQAFVNLPADEGIEVQMVSDKVYMGENWYLGNYRSRVELNTDLPTDLNGLLDFMCHEGYPGHHTEFVLKEQRLFRERGYLEQSIFPIISPQSVISEGIATSACELIFSPEEAEQWLAEHIYPEAGIEPDTVDIAKLRKALELLEYPVGGNAAFLLHEGRSDDEVMKYLIKYSMLPDEEVLKYLEFLKVPFQQAYIFTYFYGRQLIKPWLQRPDRLTVFCRFLTEQVYPSELVKEAMS
ncbi:MAG TPA: hypothetical protein VNW73_06920 [Ktedonobacteraceae bacterium]|nr:hypothetical protein [Ktedonobacteraceae bacterium]